MEKWLWKYRYGFLFIFPLLLVIFSFLEADTRFSRDLSSFFPKVNGAAEEKMIYLHLRSRFGSDLSDRQKKDLARAIVRHSQKLQFPDGTKLGETNTNYSLFFLALAQTRSGLRLDSPKGYGVFALPEILVRDFELGSGTKIQRDFDVMNPSIQMKLLVLKFKENLANGLDVERAYGKIFGYNVSANEWASLVKTYRELEKSITSENMP